MNSVIHPSIHPLMYKYKTERLIFFSNERRYCTDEPWTQSSSDCRHFLRRRGSWSHGGSLTSSLWFLLPPPAWAWIYPSPLSPRLSGGWGGNGCDKGGPQDGSLDAKVIRSWRYLAKLNGCLSKVINNDATTAATICLSFGTFSLTRPNLDVHSARHEDLWLIRP